MNAGHVIRKTMITKQYSYTQYLRERDDKSILLYILRDDDSIEFYSPDVELQAMAETWSLLWFHRRKQLNV